MLGVSGVWDSLTIEWLFVMKDKNIVFELTAEMKASALRAERDFEAGKCFSEADFKERFAKWL